MIIRFPRVTRGLQVTDSIPKNRDIADLEVTPFYSEQENDYEGEGGEREMSEDKARNLDQEVLGFFKNSFSTVMSSGREETFL